MLGGSVAEGNIRSALSPSQDWGTVNDEVTGSYEPTASSCSIMSTKSDSCRGAPAAFRRFHCWDLLGQPRMSRIER